MYRSRYFSLFVISASLCLAFLLFSGHQASNSYRLTELPAKQTLVKQLGLTDLAIWSEARYTRHPSQADLFTAFQDYPGAFDHFPAGSIIGPGQPHRETQLRFEKRAGGDGH
jgi:hypothetical protein